MRACIDVGNLWQEALAVGLQLVPAYEMIYPKVCPACRQCPIQCRSSYVAGQHKCASGVSHAGAVRVNMHLLQYHDYCFPPS